MIELGVDGEGRMTGGRPSVAAAVHFRYCYSSCFGAHRGGASSGFVLGLVHFSSILVHFSVRSKCFK